MQESRAAMKTITSLLLSTALMTACGKDTPAPPHPPAPPLPPSADDRAVSQEAAKRRAQELGVGPCDDITKIRTLPFRDELGQDAQFDRMVVNFDGYRTCLVGKITDGTPVPDPSSGPKRHSYAVGNLAYDVIASAGVLAYETCLPAEISDRWKAVGAQALVEWTAIAGNREKLQACVIEQLAHRLDH